MMMLGAKLKDFQYEPRLDGCAIKMAFFSFDKFPNVDKSLGPEIKSTGRRSAYQGPEGSGLSLRGPAVRAVAEAGVWGAKYVLE